MGRLHLFFPENDLALALNLEHYTPPPAASRLRRSGQTLGMWYGDEGDKFVDEGINSQWYRNARSRYGLGPEIYGGAPTDLLPAPWGWSNASRLAFERLGFAKDMLPDDDTLDRLRELSHRRTAAKVAEALKGVLSFDIAPAAEELSDIKAVEDFVRRTGEAVLKLPWSSSGRGLLLTSAAEFESQRANVEGMIKRQGSVMGEPRMHKSLDFALLFTMEGGYCRFDGLSLFRTVQFGTYAGNLLAPQSTLHSIIKEKVAGLDDIIAALPPILSNIIGRSYDGPLGVDMMAVDGLYSVAPAVELNLRMTMGHVARLFYEKHIVDGRTGIFTVESSGSGKDEATLSGTRINGGCLSLSPPLSPFSFQVKID